jgi:hypothetical protein
MHKSATKCNETLGKWCKNKHGASKIITVKGSFELSDLCDKEFHKMAQNFGMMTSYGEPKDKTKSVTIGIAQQLKGHPAEPEMKKPRVQQSSPGEVTEEGRRTSAT